MNLQEKCDTFVRQLDMLGWRAAGKEMGYDVNNPKEVYYDLYLINDNHRWLHKGDINFVVTADGKSSVVKFVPHFNMNDVSCLSYREVQIVTSEMMNIKRLCDTFNDLGIPSKYFWEGNLGAAFKKAYAKTGRRLLKY